MTMTEADINELEETGRVWFRQVLTEQVLGRLEEICVVGRKPGMRLDWSDSLKEAIGPETHMASIANTVLPNAHPVRFVVFNKSSESNWLVPWHQDRVIAVKEKCDVNGFSSWTQKSGVWHCEAPIDIFQDMVFARIHLDDSDAENGCLQIAKGTHQLGKVRASDAGDVAGRAEIETCVAQRGDVLFVKALTLHRSKPSEVNAMRRTLRVDYSKAQLPCPLRWVFSS